MYSPYDDCLLRIMLRISSADFFPASAFAVSSTAGAGAGVSATGADSATGSLATGAGAGVATSALGCADSVGF